MAQNLSKSSTGAYFEMTPGGRQTPVGDYFEMTPGGDLTSRVPTAPTSGTPDGLGKVAHLSPLLRDWRRYRQVSGLGQDAEAPTVQTATVDPQVSAALVATGLVLGALVRGVSGYVVGRAVAPNPQSETKYAMIGIPVGVFFGTFGLGVQAAVALSKR